MHGLAFETVTKRFDDVVAVDRFDLTVAEGEFVALVGPSGCGKTTTLRMLAGLEEVTDGRIRVGGRDVTQLASRDRNLAMVFQSYALYPHMTAAENIGFALSLKGLPKAEIEVRVREAAERMSIAHLLHRRPRELSGGQRQRVAVARCIVREPAAFLFDEPLSNLDAKLRGSARVEIARLQKGLGITTLYVTHDQVEAMTMADRVVLMDGGRIRQTGTPMELYQRPRDLFVAAFLGAPAMNLVPGVLQRSEAGAEFVADGLRLALPRDAACAGGPATLGIRPESIRAAPDGAGEDATLQATALHVECLGAETLVRFEFAGLTGAEFVARLPGTHAFERGRPVTLSVARDAFHLFDEAGLAVDLPWPARCERPLRAAGA
ncbi:ABC transporter ATP-binding protein [Polymorphum gilvum]|nr:ABC transporter ATP-binding protein [Polymorphum gilvum]